MLRKKSLHSRIFIRKICSKLFRFFLRDEESDIKDEYESEEDNEVYVVGVKNRCKPSEIGD